MQRVRRDNLTGFTLVEVIIAIGIFAMSILAIIAFLGSIGKSTSDVLDSAVASRIADNVRAELENENLDALFSLAAPGNPAILYATSDGERVRLKGTPADADEETGNPPGIDQHNRYFEIEIRRLENSLATGANFTESAMLPLSVRVVWPYQVKTGPASSEAAEPQQQSHYVFNTVILRKE